jgi:hypothetical protein
MFLDRWLENYTDDGNYGDIEKMKVFSLRVLHEGKSAVRIIIILIDNYSI